MVWQDIVISIASILFAYSLAFQVYHGFKKKKGFITLTASGLTAFGMIALAICYLTLNMYMSATSSTIIAALWITLFIQRIIYKKE
jgi:hypothetical protein